MSFPLINPQSQFFDSSGAPLASGTIEFRNPDDDTYINSYPTADDADAQTNANSNPLTLDARGEAPTGIYLEEGVTYKITLKDSDGNVIWTQDDVLCPVFPHPITSGETSAGLTIVDYHYPPGQPERYGAAVAYSAGTDDTTYVQNALDSGEKLVQLNRMYEYTYVEIPDKVTLQGRGIGTGLIRRGGIDFYSGGKAVSTGAWFAIWNWTATRAIRRKTLLSIKK